MKVHKIEFLAFLVLLLTVSSINQWSSIEFGNTTFWWVIYAVTIATLLSLKKNWFDVQLNPTILPIKLYLGWGLICIIRGSLVADNYWEWKTLTGTGFVLLLPIFIYAATHPFIVHYITKTWLKFGLPAFFIFLPFFSFSDAIGRYLVPVPFLLLFFTVLPNKWRIILLAFAAVIVFQGFESRSNIIRLVIALAFGLIPYFKSFLRPGILKAVHFLLMAIPILLFTLAVSGVFNVFKMDTYLGEIAGKVGNEEEEITADTRTFIYLEGINSAIKNKYVLFGRTPARGYDSESFGMHAAEDLGTKRYERYAGEVNIINIFTWLGIVGVVLVFFVFLKASYLAIYQSENIYIKIVGLYVSFRWLYTWVEDFTNFDLNYIFLWILISMCYSNSFRSMTNQAFKIWINGIFKTRRFYNNYWQPEKNVAKIPVQ